MLGVSWPTERLFASQESLYSRTSALECYVEFYLILECRCTLQDTTIAQSSVKYWRCFGSVFMYEFIETKADKTVWIMELQLDFRQLSLWKFTHCCIVLNNDHENSTQTLVRYRDVYMYIISVLTHLKRTGRLSLATGKFGVKRYFQDHAPRSTLRTSWPKELIDYCY